MLPRSAAGGAGDQTRARLQPDRSSRARKSQGQDDPGRFWGKGFLKGTQNRLDFLPAQWLAQVDGLKASMTMGQPFPGVWLPHGLEINAALTFALGQVEFHNVQIGRAHV